MRIVVIDIRVTRGTGGPAPLTKGQIGPVGTVRQVRLTLRTRLYTAAVAATAGR